MSSAEQLFFCIGIVWMLTMLISMALPRPWFVWIFRTLYPFMPEKLSDLDKKD